MREIIAFEATSTLTLRSFAAQTWERLNLLSSTGAKATPPAREQWLLNASKTPTDQQCRESAYSLAKELSLAAPMHGGLLCHLKTTTVPLALEQLPRVESQPPWKNTGCFSAILPGTWTTAPVCNLECPREPMQADPAGGDL